MLAIIDYGMGNLNSVAKAFAHVAPQLEVRITSDAREIARAQRVVLPGQAAMPDTMRALRETGMLEATRTAHASGKPFLGVCLGLQLLFDHSEEGNCPALGFFPGHVRRFANPLQDTDGRTLKVPHMGWNAVFQPTAQMSHPCWHGIPSGSAFYFANSYFVEPAATDCVAGTANYPAPFCVAFAHGNVFAVQFHPEKSAAHGLQLLKNFTHWTL
jgi:imidazole glycerol-phosphate synthase subunit HisH